MNKTVFFLYLIFSLSFISAAEAGKDKYYYDYIHKATGEVREKHKVVMEDLKDGLMAIDREVESADKALIEEMIVDEEGSTISWMVKDEKNNTDYQGKREGNKLILTGKKKGKVIDKEVELDDKLFYFTPKFNLTPFILSEAEQVRFWMLRKDELTKYLMQAKKKAIETLEIDGEKVEVIRVYYSATGPGEKFYKRTYYFRKSDGIFLKKKAPKKAKSLVGVLVKEK